MTANMAGMTGSNGKRGAVIFDFDGVLADSLSHFMQLYKHVASHFGRGEPPETVAQFRLWYKPRWEQNYVDMGYTEEELPQVLDYASSCVSYDGVGLFEAAVDAVRELARHHHLGIASTTDSGHIRRCLDRAGIGHCFPIVVGGEDGGSDKARRYRQAVEALGVSPSEAVAVGDTALDVESAREVGMRTIGVTYGWSDRSHLESAGPDRVIHSPEEIADAVREVLEVQRLMGDRPARPLS